MVALSATTSSKPVHARMRAALDLVLEKGWTTAAQLAAIGGVDVSTIRRWRRGGGRIDQIEAVARWCEGPLDGKARMAFGLAFVGTGMHLAMGSRDLDIDGDGRVTHHDCMKGVLRAQIHLATMTELLMDGVTSPDRLAAVRHEGAEAMALIPTAMQAMEVAAQRPFRSRN